MDGQSGDKNSIWWTLAGVMAGSAAGLGIGYKLGAREKAPEKPCACKAKLPKEGQAGTSEAKSGGEKA